ncbi:MAG: hypothetical protein VCA57_19030 [Pseudomonas sp.]|uniref:hypothetical protein n=1 Tax=Pseudomonas sp. TaxID=306 RepID=UPI003982C520
MPIVIQRPCAWCGQMIDTMRSHTKLHGKCHMPLHRKRQQLMPGEGPAAFFTFIESELKEGRHPNPIHPINQPQELQEDETH